VKIRSGVRQGCCHQFYSFYTTLLRKFLKGFGDFRIGQVIHTVKYAEGLVLMAKKEMALQGIMTL